MPSTKYVHYLVYVHYTIVTWRNDNGYAKDTMGPLRWSSGRTPNIISPPNIPSLAGGYDYTS